MDPDLFYAEPVSAVFFNADPDLKEPLKDLTNPKLIKIVTNI